MPIVIGWFIITTIAAKTATKEHPATIACDLQFTHSSGTKMKGLTKILTVGKEAAQEIFGVDGAYIGFSGNTNSFGEIVNWFHDRTQKQPKCGGVELLMLTSEGKLFTGTNLRNWTYLPAGSHAIGSGSQFAIGAMESGKTPGEAVKVASKHDIYTGMGVKEYSFS